LTLAIGIGATTAMFSLVNAVLLRPLPFAEPAGLARIYTEIQTPDGAQPRFRAATNEFLALRRDSQSWASLDAWSASAANVRDRFGAVADQRRGGNRRPSSRRSRAAGARPAPRAARRRARRPLVALISYRLWQNAFGGDPAIVGRDLVLNGRAAFDRRRDAGAVRVPDRRVVHRRRVGPDPDRSPRSRYYDHSVWMLGRLEAGACRCRRR
jgi:hypothetical protein